MKKILAIIPILFFLWLPGVSHAELIDNLIHYWKLDRNSNDSVGSADGTDLNVTYGPKYGMIVGGVHGNKGPSNDSGGVATSNIDLGSVPDTEFKLGDAWSVSAWVKIPDITHLSSIIGNRMSIPAGNVGWMLAVNNDSAKVEMIIHGNFSENQFFTSSATLATDTWYHLVFTIDANNVTHIYVNGVGESTGTYAGLDYHATGESLYIGAAQAGIDFNFNCDIDEVGVWNRELTSAEVAALYNGGKGLKFHLQQWRRL